MPLIRIPKSWELDAAAVTPEKVYLKRRQLLAGLGLVGAGSLLNGCYLSTEPNPGNPPVQPPSGFLKDLYPAPRNFDYALDRGLTTEYSATHFNNFYEYSTNEGAVWRLVSNFVVAPWTLEVGGLVQNPGVFDLETLVRMMPLEERLYRFRCVEAWSMAVPWTGFQLSRLLDKVQPLSSARFVRFVSVSRPEQQPGIDNSDNLPWPYFEGLRLDEAMNELTILATGIYGKPIPTQNGAPIRLVVPWKYGFKSIKSIVKIELVAEQPGTFWSQLTPTEYDFLANVDPGVPHPRWSQATEQPIDGGPRVDSLLYNGYGDTVASLYT